MKAKELRKRHFDTLARRVNGIEQRVEKLEDKRRFRVSTSNGPIPTSRKERSSLWDHIPDYVFKRKTKQESH